MHEKKKYYRTVSQLYHVYTFNPVKSKLQMNDVFG